MFEKFKNLKRALLSRAPSAQKIDSPKSFQGQNSNDDIIMSDFRRQFLAEISRSEGEIIVAESHIVSAAKMAAIIMPVILLVAAIGIPWVTLAASILFAVYGGSKSFNVISEVSWALKEASHEITEEMRFGEPTSSTNVERWLEQNKDKLALYLDKLEKHREENLRLSVLIKRINRDGNADTLKNADQDFLRGKGYKNLKAPIAQPLECDPDYLLSLWHQSQIRRALDKDVSRRAGSGASVIRRMLGIKNHDFN